MSTNTFDQELRYTGTTDQPLPVWVRPPTTGREHFTGLTRPMFYSLAKRGKIRTVSLATPGQNRATRLFHLRSVLDYIDGCIQPEVNV